MTGTDKIQSLKPAESIDESQQVTENIAKGGSRSSPDIEDEAISTSFDLQSPLTGVSRQATKFLDEAYSSRRTSGRSGISRRLDDDSESASDTDLFIDPMSTPRTDQNISSDSVNSGGISRNIPTSQPANKEQVDEPVSGMLNEISSRLQSTETACIATTETNNSALLITHSSKGDCTSLTQINCIDESTTDETISYGSSELEIEDSSEGGELLLSFKKQELLQRLMTLFYTQLLPSQRRTARGFTSRVDAAGSTRSSSSSIGQEVTSLSKSGSAELKLKRGRDQEGFPPGDGGDEDGRRKRSLKPSSDPQNIENGRRFACPFFKYDPNMYSKIGSCIGPGFASVSRVKFVSLYTCRTIVI